jgi:hypothetical protein
MPSPDLAREAMVPDPETGEACPGARPFGPGMMEEWPEIFWNG